MALASFSMEASERGWGRGGFLRREAERCMNGMPTYGMYVYGG